MDNHSTKFEYRTTIPYRVTRALSSTALVMTRDCRPGTKQLYIWNRRSIRVLSYTAMTIRGRLSHSICTAERILCFYEHSESNDSFSRRCDSSLLNCRRCTVCRQCLWSGSRFHSTAKWQPVFYWSSAYRVADSATSWQLCNRLQLLAPSVPQST